MLTCLLNRWKLSACLNSLDTPSPELQDHMDSCHACHEYYQSQKRLVEKLRRPPLASPTPYLHSRIVASINNQGTSPHTAWNKWLSVGMATAACVALAGISLQYFPSVHQPPVEQPLALNTDHTVALPWQAMGLSTNHSKIVLSGAWEEPLREELNHVIKDARNAADFLASSFVTPPLSD